MNTREVPCSICGEPDSLENYYNNYRSYFDKTRFCCADDAYANGFTIGESDKGRDEERNKYKDLPSDIPFIQQTRASMTPTQVQKHREELLMENRTLKADKVYLEGQVKHLTLKIEAMEIIEKMLHNQIKDLIERHNNLMDVVRQNSKLVGGDSSEAVRPDAKAGQTE